MFIKVKGRWQIVLEIVMIVLGTAFVGFGFSTFLEPKSIAGGGFSGLSQIINTLLNNVGVTFIPTSLIYLVLNAILFIFAIKALGKKFGIRAVLGTLSYTGFMYLFDLLPKFEGLDVLLCAICGGICIGIGLGLVVRFGGSTGGSDMIGCIVNKKSQKITVGTIVLVINFMVVVLSVFVFNNGLNLVPYTLLQLLISTKTVDLINEGYKSTNAFYILTDKPEDISKNIYDNLKRGTTRLEAQGAFSKEEKAMLVCVVNEFQVRDLKYIVKSIDENAFMYSCKVSEVMGANFIKVDENPEQFSSKIQIVKLNEPLQLDEKPKTTPKKLTSNTQKTKQGKRVVKDTKKTTEN